MLTYSTFSFHNMYEIVKGPDKVNPPYCEIQGIPLLELVLSKFYTWPLYIWNISFGDMEISLL